jgi:hypothetical protein
MEIYFFCVMKSKIMRWSQHTLVKVGVVLLLGFLVFHEIKVRRLYGNAHLLPFPNPETFRHQHVVTLGRALAPEAVLPRYFKWKEKMLVEPRSQGGCASCWAFSIADVMADRVSLHTRGNIKKHLSPQELLSCFRPRWFTCQQGGIPEIALNYVVVRGLLAEDMYPYENLEKQKIEDCKIGRQMGLLEAWNLDEKRHEKDTLRIFAKQGSIRYLCEDPVDQATIDRNVLNLKMEIMNNGPVIGTIMVYNDLYQYDADKVYEVSPGARLMGGHAIEIFGWADAGSNTAEEGFQGAYWIAKNHWGLTWPNNLPKQHSGFFYIRMGVDMAGIESRASSADPLLTQEMKAFSKNSTWLSSAYTSYDAYVNDPERQNFFNHLAQRRRKENNRD